MKFSIALFIVAAFGAAQGGFITGPLNAMGTIIKGAGKIGEGVSAVGSALGIGGSSSARTSASAAGASAADSEANGGSGGLFGAIGSATGAVIGSVANVANKTTSTWNKGVQKVTETVQAPFETAQTHINELQNKLDEIPIVGDIAKPLTTVGGGKMWLASSAIGALGNAEQGKTNLINAGIQGGLGLASDLAGGLSGSSGAKGSGLFGVSLLGR